MQTIHSISHYLPQLLKPSLGKFGFVLGILAGNWREVIGEKFYECSFPERLIFPKGERTNAVLTLAVESYKSIYFQQIQNELLDRINAYLGYKAIGELRIVQRPIYRLSEKGEKKLIVSDEVKKEVAAILEGVKDEKLKSSLQRIGEAIFSRKVE